MIYNNVQNLIFATKFSSIFLAKKKKNVWFSDYHLLQYAQDGTHVLDAKYKYVFVA